VLDAGLEGATAYLAMEYVAAETLDVALRHLAPAALNRALPILKQLAEAIDAAWASGSGHGSLHPRDIFITLDSHEVRVTGFGVVPTLETIGIKAPVRRPYAAPERVNGESWGIRSDVYSLGAVAHELLTRRRPAGSGEQDGALTSDTSAEQRVQIRRVLACVLAERPERRFASGRAFVEALEGIARGETVVTPADEPEEEVALEAAAAISFSDFPSEVFVAVQPDPIRHADVSVTPPPEPAPVIHEPTIVEPQDDLAARESIVKDEPVVEHEPTVEHQPTVEHELVAATVPLPEFDSPPPALPAAVVASVRSEEAGSPSATFDLWQPVPAVVVPPAILTPAAFPWSAMAAVAVVSVLLGTVIGYQYARWNPGATSPPVTAARTGDTDVAVPESTPSSTPGGPTASPLGSEAPGSSASSALPPVAQIAATPGRLIIRSTPAGALLIVDGRRRGQTPFTVRDLTLGPHTVEVARPGYVPHKESVTLGPRNAVKNLTIQLQPGEHPRVSAARPSTPTPAVASTSKGLGSMFVDSRPQSARVIVDGRFIGVTPLRVPELVAGNHAVRLELAGHRSFVTSVDVKPTELARVTAALEEGREQK
jgi:hypothetical protein